jgi:hypothetical protein
VCLRLFHCHDYLPCHHSPRCIWNLIRLCHRYQPKTFSFVSFEFLNVEDCDLTLEGRGFFRTMCFLSRYLFRDPWVALEFEYLLSGHPLCSPKQSFRAEPVYYRDFPPASYLKINCQGCIRLFGPKIFNSVP